MADLRRRVLQRTHQLANGVAELCLTLLVESLHVELGCRIASSASAFVQVDQAQHVADSHLTTLTGALLAALESDLLAVLLLLHVLAQSLLRLHHETILGRHIGGSMGRALTTRPATTDRRVRGQPRRLEEVFVPALQLLKVEHGQVVAPRVLLVGNLLR